MKSFRVLAASVNPNTGFIEVVKEITADDNTTTLHLHAFHPETLEWKAAEFGLTDPVEIIDGIMHEPYFEDVQSLQLDVNAARTLLRTRLADAKSKFTNATPRNTGLIKAQLRTAGVDQRHIDAADTDPMQTIVNACPFDLEVIAAKREHVDRARGYAAREREQAAARGPQTSLLPGERAAQLRERLRTTISDEGRPPETPIEEATLPPIILSGKPKRK